MSFDIASQVLFEDNHLIIINKRPAQLVQPDNSGDDSLEEEIKLFLKQKYNKPGEAFLGVAHRLDRPVSGAVVFAKTSKALIRLNEMLKRHELQKTYWAVVKTKPPQDEGLLSQYILRNQKQNKSLVYNMPVKGSLLAELKYRLIACSDRYYLLEIDLMTGRHHQIRAQLAAMDCPIKGDVKYGFARTNPDGSICLHARKVEFVHPVSKEKMSIVAPLPDTDIWKIFRAV
ncbi:MAG TPA: RluA family pseudouridine synthase [Bacteroidales bacterium]|nr:RluA family pseudouridine synthase [Bacteroidales bacterium]